MYRRLLKPLLDRSGAAALLLLFSPLMAVALAAVYISLGRPLFFTQRRPGLGGRLFTIYKFRTMDERCDAGGNLLPDDQRLRGAGKVIRSLSLDELPQLYNVLRGEMSFIGPRPLLEEYLPLYNGEQKRRHDVKPGITGWAQVNGRNAISWKQKFAYDVWYVDHLSWRLDLRIALLTIKKVFVREGINAEGHVTVEKFNGNN
ncbi:sugar transferase [Sulfurimonas sp. HSL-1656]|uniref:sugar transferase n=1 Tax=Thiomicrolovo subterrani TaxID=3131934 RepID=UPI0031F8DBCF